MIKVFLLISVIALLSLALGREMYKVQKLAATLEELEHTKQAIIDRKGKEVIHDELGGFIHSKENNDDVVYNATTINKLYSKDE